MNISKLSLAVATVLGSAGASTSALAIDLYVDVKTKQIYAEPGPNRQLMGSFVQVGEAQAAKPAESAELAAVKEDLAVKDNEIKALQEHMTEVEQVKVHADKKGLHVETADKNFKFSLSGRLQADANFSDGDHFYQTSDPSNEYYSNDGTEVRRARIKFKGTVYKDWNFILQTDFAKNGVAIKDAFLEYAGFDWGTITAGEQKQLFSNELWMSSNDILFMERSLMNVLNNPTAERAMGLTFQTHGENWYGGIGAFGDAISVNTTSPTGQGVTEGWGVNARGTWAPIMEKTRLIHMGLAGNYRRTDNAGSTLGSNGNTFNYKYTTTNMSNLTLINAKLPNVNSVRQLGLEGAGMYGPFSIQSEYNASWLDRSAGLPNLTYDGWYVEGAWSLTGESRKYDGEEGKFKRLKPNKNFSPSNGTWGAFELAARYNAVNLDDATVATMGQNGEMTNVSLGLNWYMNENVRFMADWTKTLRLKNGYLTPTSGDITDLDVYQFRGQWAF